MHLEFKEISEIVSKIKMLISLVRSEQILKKNDTLDCILHILYSSTLTDFLSLSLCLSLTLSLTQTHTHTLTFTHTRSLSLSLSHTHTHTHTLSHSSSLSPTPSLSHFLSPVVAGSLFFHSLCTPSNDL